MLETWSVVVVVVVVVDTFAVAAVETCFAVAVELAVVQMRHINSLCH